MIEDSCPICLESQTQLETSCGHRFCAACIIQVWESGRLSNAIRCPLCRRSVSLIVEDAAKVKSIDEKIKLYNWKFGRQCSWADYIRDIPIVVRLLLRDIWHSVIVGVRDPNTVVTLAVQAQVLIVILSCLLYVFLPHDLVPDLTSPIGLLDDFILVVFVLVFLSNVYRSLMSHHQPRRVLTRTAQQAPETHFSPLHHRFPQTLWRRYSTISPNF